MSPERRFARRAWLLPVGGALAVAGTVCVVLALTSLVWFDFSHAGVYRDIEGARDFADSPYGPRFMRDYAQWIGWALLVATILTGLGSIRLRRRRAAFRVITAVLGLAGAAASALNLLSMTNNFYGDWHQVLGGMSVGIPVATVGFMVLAAGLAVASARSPTTAADPAT